MNKIDHQLEVIKNQKRLGLMTHVIVGYPSLLETEQLVKTMIDSGVDFIELQIPFSDPLADGPTIMKASEEALAQGIRVKDSFLLAKKLAQDVAIPLLFMGYFNTVFKYGIDKFCQDARNAGVSGLIIPDIPLEEADGKKLDHCCKVYDLYLIRLLSPSSTIDRIKLSGQKAQGFVYCTARQGITDAKKKLDPKIAEYLKTIKKHLKLPLAVGFGISSAERVEMIRPFCEIAVVGSAIIDIIHSSTPEKRQENVADFIRSLKII